MKPIFNQEIGGLPSVPQNHPFYPSSYSQFRRHSPYFVHTDYRIYEMNKRLQQHTDESDSLWWEAFVTEFFEDDATLTLTFCLEDGPKRYTIGRTLIPRYFRSIFEGDVTDLHFSLKHPKESFHNTTITLDCDHCVMVAHHGKQPLYNKVYTEGRLILEFTSDDLMRIKSWHFATQQHRELVPRNLIALQAQQQDPALLEQLSKNITRQGLTNSTLNYLRLCVILQPMQELMSRQKDYGLKPRDCLKTALFQKQQKMVAPPETQRPPNKRRKQKSSASKSKKKNTSPGPPNLPLESQKAESNSLSDIPSEVVKEAMKIFPKQLVLDSVKKKNGTLFSLQELGDDILQSNHQNKVQSNASTVSNKTVSDTLAENNPSNLNPDIFLCTICMDSERGALFQPCGHLVACWNCAHRISDCPVCRKPITHVVRAYYS